jgi:hypothetical protein
MAFYSEVAALEALFLILRPMPLTFSPSSSIAGEHSLCDCFAGRGDDFLGLPRAMFGEPPDRRLNEHFNSRTKYETSNSSGQ